MTQEELEKKLSISSMGLKNPEIDLKWVNPDKYGLSRSLQVTTKYGYVFIIEWWKNLLTFHLGNGVTVWADDVRLSNTMPNNSLLDIRATFDGKDYGLCIPVLKKVDE